MIDLTYRGANHTGKKNAENGEDAVLNYRGASYHSADQHKGKPQANRSGLRYRGAPQR